MTPEYHKQLQEAIATVTTARKDTLEYDIAVNMVANAASMLLRQDEAVTKSNQLKRSAHENY